ncbi:hypothetical protein, partial [Lactococcus cremoris]|uniref:hypothetical protein n=1 Tax=Lactococcus lactis subsp. cremoris TaxID=1359 RepID=UPI001E5D60CC
MYATITGIASIVGGGGIAVPMIKADTIGSGDTTTKEVDSDKLLVNQSSVNIPASNANVVETGAKAGQEVTITLSDEANNPTDGYYINVDGYWTQGICAINNDDAQLVVLLVSKADPSKVYYATATYDGSVHLTSSPALVTTSPQNLSSGSTIVIKTGSNFVMSSVITQPKEATNNIQGIYVKYRSMTGGEIPGTALPSDKDWQPEFPKQVSVIVKYQDEAGHTLRTDTKEVFYNQIQEYTVSDIPPVINGLTYDPITSTGKLIGRDQETVILRYKDTLPSESDSTSDSVSDSNSTSDSESDSDLSSDSESDSNSTSDSISDSDSTSDSVSDSDSTSDSVSDSDSTSDSVSGSDSTSDSISDSDSTSDSVSDSDSTSDSVSDSDSTSSDSASDSDSVSDSVSDSDSSSDSLSDSLSDSDSMSDSASDSDSTSDSISDSASDSDSTSDSLSDSVSDSDSTSDSTS